ncbi:hypothetical protein GCM10009595_12980 [Falsarthrobacter nasiphocae]
MATRMGLRGTRPSSDVDLLVHPDDLDSLSGYLRTRGWIPRPEDDEDNVFPHHSTTYFHPQWPIDIDLHWKFPGFSLEPSEVFVRLSKHEEISEMAGLPVRHLDRTGTALIQLLHALRSPWTDVAREDLAVLASVLHEHEMKAICSLSSECGSLAPLRPFVQEHFPTIAADFTFPPIEEEWIVRTTNRSSASIRLVNLYQAPWRNKPILAFKALFPTREGLAANNLSAREADPAQLRRMRRARLVTFVRNLPAAITDARRTLKGLTRHD